MPRTGPHAVALLQASERQTREPGAQHAGDCLTSCWVCAAGGKTAFRNMGFGGKKPQETKKRLGKWGLEKKASGNKKAFRKKSFRKKAFRERLWGKGPKGKKRLWGEKALRKSSHRCIKWQQNVASCSNQKGLFRTINSELLGVSIDSMRDMQQ
jgi:hypothetical protein